MTHLLQDLLALPLDAQLGERFRGALGDKNRQKAFWEFVERELLAPDRAATIDLVRAIFDRTFDSELADRLRTALANSQRSAAFIDFVAHELTRPQRAGDVEP